MGRMTNDELKQLVQEKEQMIEHMKNLEGAPEEEVLAKIQELTDKIAALEAENEAIKENIPKGAASREEYLNQKVHFYAMKDNDKYKNDITVTVNGKNYVLKRGVDMMIPRFLAMAIRDSDMQKKYAADVMQGYKDNYKLKEAQLV